MEAVASLLLTGDESLRRAAAEALANQPEEGHPTLEEGSRLEDPAVRRAVVFGLGRTRQPWAIKIVEKLRTEDSQWMVQDAANQVVQAIQEINPRLPRRLPPLTQMGWLVAFAAERGMGIAPGKPAHEMFNKALQEGNEDQRMAALYYIESNGEEDAVLPLYKTYFSSFGEKRELAYEALWTMAARGIELPPPVQFGLK
jgi:HEAT repeat protein